MKRVLKGLTTLFVAIAAVVGASSSCQAGSVWMTFYNYTWAPTYTASSNVGPVTFNVNAYSLTSANTQVVGSTGPGPDVTVSPAHFYHGGPLNSGSSQAFNTSVPYYKVIFGSFFVGSTNPNPPPNGPSTSIFVTSLPTRVSAASVPH